VTEKRFAESTLPFYERFWERLRESFSADSKARQDMSKDWWQRWRGIQRIGEKKRGDEEREEGNNS
jgi:hypothetical protein